MIRNYTAAHRDSSPTKVLEIIKKTNPRQVFDLAVELERHLWDLIDVLLEVFREAGLLVRMAKANLRKQHDKSGEQ